MNSIKLFFEEGRTTIVIDEPTSEMNESLRKQFYSNVSEITSLLAPAKEQIITPAVEPVTMSPKEETKISAVELLKDTNLQVKLGIDETILILAEDLGYEKGQIAGWIQNASMEEKKGRYSALRNKILSINEIQN